MKIFLMNKIKYAFFFGIFDLCDVLLIWAGPLLQKKHYVVLNF